MSGPIPISDLSGLSKPLVRLIEVVSQGVGRVFRSYFLRRDADAKAYEIKVIAEAVAKATARNQVPVTYQGGRVEAWRTPEDGTFVPEALAIDDRAAARVHYQQRRRQDNIERITGDAAEQLSTEEEVPNERPDEDWISRFFAGAQDVSTEAMQSVWARILAGEIKRPGTYSLRTLDCLRNLSKVEAEAFVKAGHFALALGNENVIYLANWIAQHRDPLIERHLITLAEAGLLYPSPLDLTLPPAAIDVEGRKYSTLRSGGLALVIRARTSDNVVPNFLAWKVTSAGRELLTMLENVGDEEYLAAVGRVFLNRGASEASIGDVVLLPGKKFNVENHRPVRR
jgi:uncharacterized repeat protein (TIGR03899 family)